ncbi:hypothetical protein EON63_04115 [archaeon]|nr:MAG: hypothetical protein EON63_04115 [archaeon]
MDSSSSASSNLPYAYPIYPPYPTNPPPQCTLTNLNMAVISQSSSATASPDSSRRQHKRLSPAVVSDQQMGTPPKRRVSRTDRLNTLDNFTAVLSAGDEEALFAFISHACCSNVLFTSSTFTERYEGPKCVFFFWLLLIMMYPDMTITLLDKRIFSPDREGDWLDENSGVEYVYKFAGTPVFHLEVSKTFAQLMRLMPDQASLPPATPSTHILALLQERICTKSVVDEAQLVVKNFLAEMSLSFDAHNKIVRWSFDLLTTNKI